MMLPRRTDGVGLLAAEYWMVPSPWPDGVEVIASHGASLDAVHGHSRAAETVTVPVPPPAATGVAPPREIAHRVPDGLTTVLVEDPQPAAANTAMNESAIADEIARRRPVSGADVPSTAERHAKARPAVCSS